MTYELFILVLVGTTFLNLVTWLVVLGRLRLILDFIEEKEGKK